MKTVEGTVGRLGAFVCTLLFSVAAQANDYRDTWGPAIGASVQISAADQSGTVRSVADLAGENGLLLFLNRSADW